MTAQRSPRAALIFPLLFSTLPALANASSIQPATEPQPVTPDSFIRAETDRMFTGIAQRAGGINKLWKIRQPVALDQQPVIRMNRDTLYIGAVVDTEGGASFTLPEMPDDRYASVMVIDNDHYTSQVIYEPGTYQIAQDTKYVMIGARFQIKNPLDKAEIQLLNELQDQFIIKANNTDPLLAYSWDLTSLQELRSGYESEFQQLDQYASDWMGPRGEVNEETRHLAAAGAWGLLPEQDATYINYSGHHDYRICHSATYQQPDHDAFWSITVYNANGYMDSDNNIVNSSNVALNDDGSFTMYFGSEEACGQIANRVDTSPDWNFLMRIYRPGKSVLDRIYKLPKAEPVESIVRENVAHPNDYGVGSTAYRVSESNTYIQKHLKKAGINTFAHQREMVKVDTQQVIRENQDTLYSSAVVDVSEGATITVPAYSAYSIIQVIDMQNYSIGTVYAGESLTLDKNDLSYGDYVYLNARTQPTSNDAAGLEAAHRQQDALLIEAGSAKPYTTPDIVISDEQLLTIRTALIKDVAQGKIKDFTKLMGTRDFVDPQGHLYATAYGWGGLPVQDAGYIVIPVKAETGDCSQLRLDPPPLNYAKGGFWSVTTYNQQGWLARDKAATSHREVSANADGSITLRFNCPGADNNLDTVEPFATLLRLYVPESADQMAAYLAHARQAYVITPNTEAKDK